MAEPFGQAATQAPQPMQAAAASIASVGFVLSAQGAASTSGALPVRAEIKPPACHDFIQRATVHDQIAEEWGTPWRGRVRPSSVSPSLNWRMRQLAGSSSIAGGRARMPVRSGTRNLPQMPSRQS